MVSVREGEWSYYVSGQFNGGSMIHDTEVASVKEGEWSMLWRW